MDRVFYQSTLVKASFYREIPVEGQGIGKENPRISLAGVQATRYCRHFLLRPLLYLRAIFSLEDYLALQHYLAADQPDRECLRNLPADHIQRVPLYRR